MRASQPATSSHPSARSRQQPARPDTQPSTSATDTSLTQPPPAAPPSFATSIAPLHDLFTYCHSTAASAASPFVLACRVQSDCLILTATDLSTLYQIRITERLFDDKCRRLNFGAGTERYTALCDLLRQCTHSNTAAQPRVTYAVRGVKGSDCSTAVLELTFTLRVGSGAGLDVECGWQLPSLLRRVRQTRPTEERKEEQEALDDPKRRKRRVAAEDDLDSLDFPDLPDELLASISHPHSAAPATASQSAPDDEYVYSREIGLIVHHLLDLHLSGPAASAASALSGGAQSAGSLEVSQLREQVRLLEQQVAAQTERAERVEREMRSGGGNGAAGGNGGSGEHDVAGKRKPRQMSDRSVINPGVKKRKARGIHLEG